MKRSLLLHDSGKTMGWVLLLLLIICIVVGLKVGKVHFDNSALKAEVEEMAGRYLLERQYDLKANIINTASQYGVLLKPKEVDYKVNTNGDQIAVNFDYVKTVDLYVTTYPIHMSVHITKEMAKAKNIIQKFQSDYESGSRGSSQRILNDIEEKLKPEN